MGTRTCDESKSGRSEQSSHVRGSFRYAAPFAGL